VSVTLTIDTELDAELARVKVTGASGLPAWEGQGQRSLQLSLAAGIYSVEVSFEGLEPAAGKRAQLRLAAPPESFWRMRIG
jgi:hypothetical protein